MPASHRAPDQGPRRPSDPRRRQLEHLGRAIEAATDLRALVRPATLYGPAVLRIINPVIRELREDLGCELLNERWWLVWSWGDVLGPADDVDGAVRAVERVLTGRS